MRRIEHTLVASLAVGAFVLISVLKTAHTSAQAVPQLILDQAGQAAALDATLFLRDPFTIVSPANLSNQGFDRNTRVMIFVSNLQLAQGEASSNVHVILTDNHGQTFDLNAEDVHPVPNFNFTQVVFRIPETVWPDICTVRVRFHNVNSNSASLRIRPPQPVLSIVSTSSTLYLPTNCLRSFIIKNVGPQGSILNYGITAPDDDLEVTQNAFGALPAGVSATVTYRVQPRWVGFPAFVTTETFLMVDTPDASNYIKFPVGVSIRNAGQAILGVWGGTWSGNSFGRNNPNEAQPTAPVSGTWVLNLQAVDLAHNTAAGTLTWNGRDAYWTYTILPNGNLSPTPHDFIPNRTIQFGSANTTLTSTCNQDSLNFHLSINGAANAPNPSDAFYGPRINVDLNAYTGTVSSTGVGFSANPYNPANFDTALSSGVVSGNRLP
ncbi:MAG: hypothetical protein ACJ741_02565 [Pyrinomonadaceae bacterium]